MKHITIYWRNDPQEMELVSAVEHIKVGPDAEELITTNDGAERIRGIAREHEENLWVDSSVDVDPQEAAGLVSQWVSREHRKESLRSLINMVAQEDRQASEELAGKLTDLL